MYPLTRLILVLALAPLLPAQVGAPDRGQSKYWELPADTMIPTRTVLRQETVTLSQPAHVLVQSDGALGGRPGRAAHAHAVEVGQARGLVIACADDDRDGGVVVRSGERDALGALRGDAHRRADGVGNVAGALYPVYSA